MSSIHIVGAGPAGLMAAETYADKGYNVNVYDHKKSAGRKFLVAGHGGFNLTFDAPLDLFVTQYDAPQIQDAVRYFTPNDTRNWLSSIGIETFVGSSGKVFPVKGIKPIDVLQNWLTRLKDRGVVFHYSHRLIDFTDKELVFEVQGETRSVAVEKSVFAFGGKSWSKTGSDGKWEEMFGDKGIAIDTLTPSNSGFELEQPFFDLVGKPLKNCMLFNDEMSKKGEIVFTEYGIEGAPVYYLNRAVRKNEMPQQVYLDLKPALSLIEIENQLKSGKPTQVLKELKLTGPHLTLLKTLDKPTYTDFQKLSRKIKAFPLTITGFRPIDEVISTCGGVAWDELNEDFSLIKYPHIQCCGEMLNWDAPTGGYLLQACFSSGAWVGKC